MREHTPRAARTLAAEHNIQSSSPAAYQSSSPVRHSSAATPDIRMGDMSSQIDDGDRTPRANPGVRGTHAKFFRLAVLPALCIVKSLRDADLSKTLLR